MLVLIRRPNAPWLFLAMTLAGFALFGFAIGALMSEPAAAFGDRLPELVCLQVAFAPQRYADVFLAFPPEARAVFPQLLIPGDIVFAWGYGLQLAGLLGLLAMRLPSAWQPAGALVMWAPLAASTLDCIEDIFLYNAANLLLADPTATLPAAMTLIAGIAATLKYLALVVISPVFGIAGIVKAFGVDRSASSLLLYAVLALLLISMVLRPLQQLPPCFM